MRAYDGRTRSATEDNAYLRIHDRVLGHLGRAGAAGLTRTQLNRSLSNVSAGNMTRALDAMVERGVAARFERASKGRPALIYCLPVYFDEAREQAEERHAPGDSKERLIARILRYVESAGPNGIPLSVLGAKLGGHISLDDREEALAALVVDGRLHLEIKRVGTRGPKGKVYTLAEPPEPEEDVQVEPADEPEQQGNLAGLLPPDLLD